MSSDFSAWQRAVQAQMEQTLKNFLPSIEQEPKVLNEAKSDLKYEIGEANAIINSNIDDSFFINSIISFIVYSFVII